MCLEPHSWRKATLRSWQPLWQAVWCLHWQLHCVLLSLRKNLRKKERQSGIVNYVMGLSFITEGAIPFAAQDPLRVIPSCLAGAAVAGGLFYGFWLYFKSTSWRIICTATIGNPVMYLAAVVIGAVVGCVILGILKKERGRIKQTHT